MSESDDNPPGGLLCVLDADLTLHRPTWCRARARRYNRITLLAIERGPVCPSVTEGFDRLVTTQSFDPAARSR